ncbi:hypothetical protein Tthe_0933 [Thermoanaerobacterium thermosaccharolyticum DSM 571]|jgi:hypothetical protein|uniref:Uncharacterized protein n=1 Tax=Thermoanaerobacterium thermosaccharolyticum (strain ATCC 7956 / DSM 571 / NCIMB 9385 / NCA 3814 / NCTC 13789 / WDCM 00135 / 2032) TaxID=580327 RepID=D9TMI1_THETC|nr:hypothetical protein [Thermoanaerobacterium thermosaccharolyticum]ADL68469.1 hypothetical protein Tthe_0933 [Thermoanaerobacterium thermosaccharolyticum DSM 571]MCP2239469.1 hypothetical protein [Thermoanaerobacterium thermosaccharolyticum]
MDEITNDWHSDFYTAIREIFKNEKDKIDIIQEQYLSKEPLRIDVIIVKKNDDYGIDKQIARIFKKYNIIEYKSPEDYLSIDDYFKGLGYAYIYKSMMNDYEKTNKKVDGIKIEEVTLSFVSNSYPRKLTKFLKECDRDIEKAVMVYII